MKPRERVLAALAHAPVDRPPYFEIWIDALLAELGQPDVVSAHVNLGQDGILIPTKAPAGSNAWKEGVDEWGRVWKQGMYHSGVVDTRDDLKRYTRPTSMAGQFFDLQKSGAIRETYPDPLLFYGSHLGPFMAAYMCMGFERFFLRLMDEPAFIHEVIESRTEWTIAMFQEAVRNGADLLVLGEDAAYKKSPMISPKMWRNYVYPYHRRIVESVDCPILFHSDGNILPVLPMIIEAGFRGYHSLEPAADIDLKAVKKEYGKDLLLAGNVDVRTLAGDDLGAVRA
ncbi:MAG: uroporphyrinogen decarboxylase family protein, partial [Anaerolineaceae bacterium]